MLKDKKNVIILILSVGLFLTLLFIVATNTFMKTSYSTVMNSKVASSWNKDERLPLGSVFTTNDGTWMVIGQKPVTYLNDNYESNEAESWTFDYYCVPYPEGCRSVYSEYENTALYNKGDIKEILYVGKIDSADTEYRNWIDNYDTSINNPGSVQSHNSGALYPQAPCIVEQQLRMQGKTTSDIYGSDFRGGELGSDILNSGMYFLNYEWMYAAASQLESSGE